MNKTFIASAVSLALISTGTAANAALVTGIYGNGTWSAPTALTSQCSALSEAR